MYAPHPSRYADATGRLVSAIDSASNGFGHLGWSYDKNGNRQSETRNSATMPYVYSPPNWLYQKGSETRPKTLNGNTASTGTASFTYDGFNRLATSVTAVETTTYTYNALGERIKKINQNGLSTVFHYGPNGELLWEKDQAGNTKAYVWLDGRPLARIDNNAQIYYYHVDHLGTAQAMTDSAATVVWKAYYEPFGNATVRVNTIENNLRLPGQYYDRETGMHYNYARDYDPTTGRYVEFDPIGLAGGLNGYLYANANPLTYTDPLGLDPFGSNSAGTGGFTPAPTPFDVFVPGTSANNAFVQSVYQMGRAIKSACSDDPSEDKKKKNCQALKDSILATCASLTGRKKFDCFAAAQESYQQCMSEQ